MRLFPPAYEGLHPAFPAHDIPSLPALSGHPAFASAADAGLYGLLPLALGAVFRLPHARAFAFEATAYGALGLAFAGYVGSKQTERHIATFLSTQGIEIPGAKFVDRIGRLDFDDSLVLGAATGVACASLARRPWSVSGWKRWVGAAAFGMSAANYGVNYGVSFMMGQDARQAVVKRRQEGVAWNLVIGKTVIAVEEQKLRAAGINLPSVPGAVGPAMTATPLSGVVQQEGMSMQEMLAKSRRDKLGFDQISWPNESDEPHLTERKESSPDSLAYTVTNYTWTPSPEEAIPELEHHIENLRQRRAKLAAEAEIIWHWLAGREAEFYNSIFTASLSAAASREEEVLAARRYLEALGAAHATMWLSASQCDWMVADARKRLEQFRSSLPSGTLGHVTWTPTPLSPSAAAAKPPEKALRWLNKQLKQVEARKAASVMTKLQAEESFSSMSSLQLRQMTENPVTGGQTTMKESLQDLIRKVGEDIETANFDAGVLRKIIEDGEVMQS